MRNVGYVRISAQRVLKSSSDWSTTASGMNRIEGGTRYARKMARPTCRAPRKRNRSMAYAASVAAASDANVAVNAISIVLTSQSGYDVSNSSLWKCANVGLITQNGLPERDS